MRMEDRTWYPALVAKLETHLRAEPNPRDGAHDLAHILRVARLAGRIAEAEGADLDVSIAGALLHDLVYRPKNHPESPRTAELSAELAAAWCAEIPALAHKAEAIVHTIAAHSWSGSTDAETLEARVVQDADRLEALGAIGIARVFATGASFHSKLWHPSDPWAEHRELDDKAYTLDHFFKKLMKLAGHMTTGEGRRLAEARQKTLVAYLDALRTELQAGPLSAD
ncbi:MAG TPA: HD domain-containing protein [Holophagaceae bacterium]|nr:HD domain-containing protein [Holophagaceae bacterium]